MDLSIRVGYVEYITLMEKFIGWFFWYTLAFDNILTFDVTYSRGPWWWGGDSRSPARAAPGPGTSPSGGSWDSSLRSWSWSSLMIRMVERELVSISSLTCMTCPPHSISTLGWLTGRNWIFFKSLSPQNRTSNLYLTSLGLMWGGTGRMGPKSEISSLKFGRSGILSSSVPSSNISNVARSSPWMKTIIQNM